MLSLRTSVCQPSTKGENGDLQTGGSQMPEGHLLRLEHGLGRHLEIVVVVLKM